MNGGGDRLSQAIALRKRPLLFVAGHLLVVALGWWRLAANDFEVILVPGFTGKAKGASVDTITSGLGVTARYVRMYSRKRNTQYGDSLWEFEIYGDTNPACTP